MEFFRKVKSTGSYRFSMECRGEGSGSGRKWGSLGRRLRAFSAKSVAVKVETVVDQPAATKLAKCVEPMTDVVFDVKGEQVGEVQVEKEMRETQVETTQQTRVFQNQTIVIGKGTEVGQLITCTIDGEDGQPKQTMSYIAERVIGSGSFGIVYQARSVETNKIVAIKKVRQDKRFKNRELTLMHLLDHPNVTQLQTCFFSAEKNDVYLNLVLEYVPETISSVSRHYSKRNKLMPLLNIQLYIYQLCRALNYIHNVVDVCHRDIKPQNILMNPETHEVKLCDFGSAKILLPDEPSISYICSRYYRAPELMFGSTKYTCAIDMWSAGCVMAELLLGHPLFTGESGVDQLVEIIKILGTPTREDIKCMNPEYKEFKFPVVKGHPWHKVFSKKYPSEAIDLVSRMLQYSPQLRLTPFEACVHPFFDDLRAPGACLPNGQPLPPLFNFTPQELAHASPELLKRLLRIESQHVWEQ